MVTKDIICITCPQGCIIKVTGDPAKAEITSCEGFKCKRGKVYAENEFIRPLRILTTSVKTEGAVVPLLPVRTSAMVEVKKLTVKGPMKPGDVIVKDFMGTGADLVASGSL